MERKMLRTLSLICLFTGTSTLALAQGVTLQLTIKNHRFQPAEVKAPAGQPLTLRVINADPTPEEFESKNLRVERVIPGNSEATFKLRPLQPGRYRFFGDFNEATANGFLVVE
jgi:hypothetical protein